MALFKEKIVPQAVTFPPVEMTSLYKHVSDNIKNLQNDWNEFHTEKLTKYQKLYEGTPREEIKSFPWRNASNIVIQVVGTHVDTMVARVVGSIYENSPLWPISVLGTWDDAKKVEEQRLALEEALNYVGLNDDELDFYRVESSWAADVMKYGIGVIKSPWERDVEVQRLGIAGGENVVPIIKYDGPRPEKLTLRNFACTWDAPTLDSNQCRFKYQKIPLTKNELEERAYSGYYNKEKLRDILTKPDRGGPTTQDVEDAAARGINLSDLYSAAIWDIYECWFPYWKGNQKYRLICTYHLGSDTPLRTVFNFYPDNDEPFISAKMGYTTDGIIGRGFSELLRDYQEEITTGHNQRVDNRTLANTAIIRVPATGRFDAHFSFYPGMTIPGDKDSIEPMQVGAVYPNSVQEEMLTLKLGEDRIGSGSSAAGGGGLGAGTVGKTTGAYSSMGTYAVMQDQNKRVAQITSDFKYAHIKAGRQAAKLFGHFGFGQRAEYFGNRSELIREALESLRTKKLGFSVKAATASINREVEKQNFLLLSGILQKHYTAVGQLIQAIQNPQIDQVLKAYLIRTAEAMNMIHEKVLVAFQIDDRSRVLPEPFNSEGADPNAGNAGAGSSTPESRANRGDSVPPDSSQEQESDSSLNELSGVGNMGGVPTTTTQ